ncbi:MAG TPA: aminotransferase class I/II-fold pyridoxal phosphate-dependent enzyme [Thermodesulfobacteriota bacterium]|nr:aminotransferase class I/II-fold pyridoxal phosphate-dependent enzyme [Thermodesulfobacteriota bacterium]
MNIAINAADRRKSSRIAVDFEVFSMNNGKLIGNAVNLSSGGMLIQTRHPLGLGTKLLLEFKLGSQEPSIKAYAYVRWARKSATSDESEPSGMGVQFLSMYDYYQEKLEAHIKEGLKKINSDNLSMADFIHVSNKDIFEKAKLFWEFIEDTKKKDYNKYETMLLSASKNRVLIFDEKVGREREIIMMGSSNYLGLAYHPEVVNASKEAVRKYGTGTGSIRLLSGTNELHRELENKLAELKGCEDALVFPTGHMANMGCISALMGRKDIAVIDKKVHASILDGCKLSRGNFRTFRHSDTGHLRQVLESLGDKYDGKLIIAEGVDGIDGDILPLPEFIETANEFGAKLMIDEAHATGVIGSGGRGTASHFGLMGKVDVIMDSLSKALGGLGGYVASTREVIRYVKYYATTSFFSVSASPAMLASALAAIDLIKSDPGLIGRLWENIRYLRDNLKLLGFNNVEKSQSAIISTIVGNDLLLRMMTKRIFEEGVFIEPLPYPTVPRGEERMRLRVMSTHTRNDLDRTLEVLEKVGKELGFLKKPTRPAVRVDSDGKSTKTTTQGKEIEVTEISSRDKITESVKFSWKVYKDIPQWIPYFLINDRVRLLSGEHLYFRQNVKTRRFVAKENGEIVGTVSAFVDDRFIRYWNQKIGFLGFFEALPGRGIAIQSLLDRALEFLKSQGMEEVWAPVNIPLLFYGGGILSGGFDKTPSFLQPYTPGYYQDYFQKTGFSPIKNLPHYSIDLNSPENRDKIYAITRKANVTIKKLDKRRYEEEAVKILKIHNGSFPRLWKYVPFKEDEFVEFVREFRDLIVEGFWLVAEVGGRAVGFAGAFPQCAPVFKTISGELGATDLSSIPEDLELITEGAIVLAGVTDEFEDQEIALILLANICANMIEKDYRATTCTWEISDKEDADGIVQKLGGVKNDLQWTIYGRKID